MKIIFDDSSKYLFLNEILDPDPSILPYKFNILIRFRLGKIEIAAYIRKAFLQNVIDQNNCDYLRMFWNDIFTRNPEIKILRFTRLAFGLS